MTLFNTYKFRTDGFGCSNMGFYTVLLLGKLLVYYDAFSSENGRSMNTAVARHFLFLNSLLSLD